MGFEVHMYPSKVIPRGPDKVTAGERAEGIELDAATKCTTAKRNHCAITGPPQCFSNLICNSIKFTRKGWINLTVDMLSSTDGRVELRFVVEDTGIGMFCEWISIFAGCI